MTSRADLVRAAALQYVAELRRYNRKLEAYIARVGEYQEPPLDGPAYIEVNGFLVSQRALIEGANQRDWGDDSGPSTTGLSMLEMRLGQAMGDHGTSSGSDLEVREYAVGGTEALNIAVDEDEDEDPDRGVADVIDSLISLAEMVERDRDDSALLASGSSAHVQPNGQIDSLWVRDEISTVIPTDSDPPPPARLPPCEAWR